MPSDRLRCTNRTLRIFLVLAGLVLVAPTLAAFGDSVVVQLHNGRVLTGEVSSQSDNTDLWLHSKSPSISIQTSVLWSEIHAVRVGTQALAQPQWKPTLLRMKKTLPRVAIDLSKSVGKSRTSVKPRVETLDFSAKLANWDRDWESDGFEIRLMPVTFDGDVVPTEGNVVIRLWGRRSTIPQRVEFRSQFGFHTNGATSMEYAPLLNYERYVELGRWNERLRSTDFRQTGYHLRLPFRAVNPEHDLDVALDAELEIQLNVTGHGILAATGPVQVRRFSPLRDDLELNRRRRYFPGE